MVEGLIVHRSCMLYSYLYEFDYKVVLQHYPNFLLNQSSLTTLQARLLGLMELLSGRVAATIAIFTSSNHPEQRSFRNHMIPKLSTQLLIFLQVAFQLRSRLYICKNGWGWWGWQGGVTYCQLKLIYVNIYCLDDLHFKLKLAKDKAKVNFSIKWRSMPLEDTLR